MARSVKKRGPTTNEKVRNESGTTREVEFRKNGTPTGPSKSKFANTVSHLARDRIKCTYKTWDLVPDKSKLILWEEIKVKQNSKP